MLHRPLDLASLAAAALLAGSLAALVETAGAQPSAQPTPDDVPLVWTTFVGGPGRAGTRSRIGDGAGPIAMDETPWRCGYATPRRAAISGDEWSVQRVLACRREQASVTAIASCHVHDGEVDERAATLSLGTVGEAGHVTVTLGCELRR